MSIKGNVIFDFVDVSGNRPDDRVDVFLKHTVLSRTEQKRDHRTKGRLKISDLESTPDGQYQVLVFPLRHRPVSRFIRIVENKTVQQTVVLPVDPDRVSRAEFPPFESLAEDLKLVLQNSSIEGHEDKPGAELYQQALDDPQKAGLLNLYAKMNATRFLNNRSVFSYVTSLTRIRGDRFFARVQRDLRDEVKNSQASRLFHEVSATLHTPPPTFSLIDSFKTKESYGNLQLTFFNNPATLDFMIDADIDDAQGIGHVFQVLSHFLTGGQTHPYDIHEILLYHQKLDPGYQLVV
jgi:hypothetical protein